MIDPVKESSDHEVSLSALHRSVYAESVTFIFFKLTLVDVDKERTVLLINSFRNVSSIESASDSM